MKIADHWTSYVEYTEDLTKTCRQLGLANGAICWFFKSPTVTFPKSILVALLLLCLYFLFDVLQYFIASWRIKSWLEKEETKAMNEVGHLNLEIDKPISLDKPIFIMGRLKVIFLILSYGMVILELVLRAVSFK